MGLLTGLLTNVVILMYTKCSDDKRNKNGVLHSLLFLFRKRNRTARNRESSPSSHAFNRIVIVSILKLIMVKAIWGWDVITVGLCVLWKKLRMMCPSDQAVPCHPKHGFVTRHPFQPVCLPAFF